MKKIFFLLANGIADRNELNALHTINLIGRKNGWDRKYVTYLWVATKASRQERAVREVCVLML